MLKSARFLSTSNNVTFSLDLPRTEASHSAFIQFIQEVYRKYSVTTQNRYQTLVSRQNCDLLIFCNSLAPMHMFEVVSYFVVVPHLFATISLLSADNCCFYIIPLKNRC